MNFKPQLQQEHWNRPERLLFILLILISACGDTGETNKQRFLIRGNEALGQQNYKEAIRFYDEALNIDSCYVPALNNAGIVRFEQKRFGQAVLYYNRALQCDPEDYDATLNRSNAFYEAGELYRAEDDLLFLIRNYPDSATLYFRKGLVQAKMKKFREALEDFSEALRLDSGLTEALINRGTVHYYLNELNQAESDLRTALRLTPGEGNALNSLGMVSSKRGDQEQAREFVEQALAFAPNDPYFLNNLGYILLLTGNMEQARENIDNSIARDPSNAWAYRNKGRYYHMNGDYENALRLYQRAMREDDFVELIHTFRGDALQALGNEQQACEAWQKGVEAGELESRDRLSAFNCL